MCAFSYVLIFLLVLQEQTLSYPHRHKKHTHKKHCIHIHTNSHEGFICLGSVHIEYDMPIFLAVPIDQWYWVLIQNIFSEILSLNTGSEGFQNQLRNDFWTSANQNKVQEKQNFSVISQKMNQWIREESDKLRVKCDLSQNLTQYWILLWFKYGSLFCTGVLIQPRVRWRYTPIYSFDGFQIYTDH